MRILFITATPTGIREGSGTAVGISVLRRALELLGHDVELLAPGPAGPGSTLARLLFDWRARRRASGARADAVVAFDMDGVFLFRSSAPRIAAIKGVLADETRFERGVARLALGVQSWFERQHVRRADRVVATSRYAAESIQALYGVPPERIRIVPEPLDLARWKAALSRTAARAADSPVILSVAHLYRRKDIAMLLEAAARMETPVRVRIVGDGPERKRLTRLCRRRGLNSRVTFLGHVSFAELAAEYRSADIFCLPSRQEGFGIVLLEAMAAGLPVVAARAGAVPELVIEGKTGVLVPPGDARMLAAELDGLARDAALRKRLGEAGERRAAFYDAPRIARDFLDAIGLPPVSAERRASEPTSP